MGSYLAEVIIALAVCVGAYLVLKPLQQKLESRMRNWLDGSPVFKKRRSQNGAQGPVINVHPIKPNKKDDEK